MDCKKCKGSATITLRKKDPYCNNCFLTNTNHKFRACIGKNKILSSNENILVCLSGGVGSLVLLDLIYNGLTMDQHKKLRIFPYFLHVTECDNVDETEKVIQQCYIYDFNVYVSHISDYMKTDFLLPEINCMPQKDKVAEGRFHIMLESMSSTARNDLLQKIKHDLFIRFAKLLQCNYIFTAETTTTLAINLLSNLALGRGSQIQNDIGFCDTRNNYIKILRPMRDISMEELDHYINIKQLAPVRHNTIQENSLQSVIRTFVTDLQDSFQATISTVCKTADKIGAHEDNDTGRKCIMCESDLGAENIKLTALEATNLSEALSHEPQNHEHANIYTVIGTIEGQDLSKPMMFKFIHKKLCYGCSRSYLEMKKSLLPNHIQSTLNE